MLRLVLTYHGDRGIPYERLVTLVAATVNQDRAHRYRLTRLKRTPSETPAETIWKGQEAIARKYIDAAHRSQRITYLEADGKRRVFLGDPAGTSGRHNRPRTWQDEADSLPSTGDERD